MKVLGIATVALAIASSASARPNPALRPVRSSAVPHTLAAVPEPASWALMMVGMAGIGVSLRRRPQTAV